MATRATPPVRRLLGRTDPLTSVLLVFPLFVVYQIGVLAVPAVMNGADFITGRLFRLLHGNTSWYLLANGVLLAAFVVAVLVLRRKNSFHATQFIPVILESALYAVSMGSVIIFLMTRVLHISPGLYIMSSGLVGLAPAADSVTVGDNVGVGGKIILSCGAGVYEELVFRAALMTGLVAGAVRVLKLRRGWALFWALGISSVLFSAAHHIVEPFHVGVFVYRIFCGLVFGAIFYLRGFAVAVYTHTLYDIFVLLFR